MDALGNQERALLIFLEALGVAKYYYISFRQYGIDSVEDVQNLTSEDFDALSVKPFHRRKLQPNICPPSPVNEGYCFGPFSSGPEKLFPWLDLSASEMRNPDEEEKREESERKVIENFLNKEMRTYHDSDEWLRRKVEEDEQRFQAEEQRLREIVEAEERLLYHQSEEMVRAMEKEYESPNDDEGWTTVGVSSAMLKKSQKAKAKKARRKERQAAEKALIEQREREAEKLKCEEAEKKRREDAVKKKLSSPPHSPVKKTVTISQPKKKKGKPRPPGDLCLQWKTSGKCSFLFDKKKKGVCKFSHPEEWKGSE